jgi:hypothetical protein
MLTEGDQPDISILSESEEFVDSPIAACIYRYTGDKDDGSPPLPSVPITEPGEAVTGGQLKRPGLIDPACEPDR